MADLVSRKPKAKTPDQHSAAVSEAKALEYRPAAAEGHAGTDNRSAEQSSKIPQDVGDAARPAAYTSTAAARASEEPSVSVLDKGTETAKDASHQAVSSAANEVAKPLVDAVTAEDKRPAPKRRKKAEPVVDRAGTAQASKVQPSVAPFAPRSFIDEMTELDTEIDELRLRLAEKLIRQNAQLRRMIARFDAR